MITFSSILLTTLLLRVAGIFVRGRILTRDTFTIVVWAAVPLLALLPIGIVLYQVLHADALSFWIPLIVVAAIVGRLIFFDDARIRELIVEQANAKLEAPVTLDDFSLSLASGFTLRGLKIGLE